MSYAFDTTLRATLTANLGGFHRVALEDAGLRRAAVAIIIADHGEGEACFLLTRRPQHLRRHAGQFALPGGRLDPDESAVEAALRETEEEMRVVLDERAVLGLLDDYPTRSGFAITPVVMWGGRLIDIDPDPNEVALVHRIPLADLDHPDMPRLRESEDGKGMVLSAPIRSLGHDIFAPTAAMLFQFREVALHGRATRVGHYDQPQFAWK